MLDAFLHDLWLFAPAFLANATPVIVARLPLVRAWHTPLHPRLLGQNKTWRGLVSGVVAAMLLALLQRTLLGSPWLPDISDVLTSWPAAVIVGALLGGGALMGDIVESALKRRMGIPPGGALPVIDGIDYILGALLFLWPLYLPAAASIVLLLVISPIASLCANTVAYLLRWKRQWY